MEEKPVVTQTETAPSPEPAVPAVKKRKWPRVLLVLALMGVSFVVGWRFMAYRWWPVLSPYVKQAVYAVIPSLEPAPVVVDEADLYHPHTDAKVGDPIGKTDSLFYYFYQPTCPYCAMNADMIVAGLPDTITLPDGTQSRVVMVALNKHDEAEGAIVDAYYEAHDIIKNDEQNDRVVPSIVVGDTYLRGSLDIKEQFLKMLLSGEGLNTTLIDGAERVE